jgi:hypothetical protein
MGQALAQGHHVFCVVKRVVSHDLPGTLRYCEDEEGIMMKAFLCSISPNGQAPNWRAVCGSSGGSNPRGAGP